MSDWVNQGSEIKKSYKGGVPPQARAEQSGERSTNRIKKLGTVLPSEPSGPEWLTGRVVGKPFL